MDKTLFIELTQGYIRAALTEEGKLCEIHAERVSSTAAAETLYLGRVTSIRSSVKAAFVDIGEQLHAFLPLDDSMRLRCGDMIIVQGLAKQATEGKGLRITKKVNLAGKWLVLVPEQSGIHISKKIKDPALREALMAVAERICPDDCGLIVRTASEDVTEQRLGEESIQLYQTWLRIKNKAMGMTKPGVLHLREALHIRLIRDMRDLSRIVVNTQEGLSQLVQAQEEKRIDPRTIIEHYEEKSQLIFDVFGIEPQIDKALHRRVWLPCGGYLIFDFCEAMTVIDVNSGKMILGRDLEDTALKVNLEAANEIARQLRLRDIGGMILIDFIDMTDAAHKQMLIERMKRNALQDRMPVVIEGMTRLGLMELTRKRIHASLHKSMQAGCTYCSGDGMLLSGEEVALRALRQVRRMHLSGQRGPFVIACSGSASQALLEMKNPLADTIVYVQSVSGKHAERFSIEQLSECTPVPGGTAQLKA